MLGLSQLLRTSISVISNSVYFPYNLDLSIALIATR